MDYLYAFLGGLLCKIYDDLNDNSMIGGHVQELLKGSQWILLTLLSYNDFNFALFNFIANGMNAANNWKEWNHSYETSLLCLTPLFLLISFSSRSTLTIYDLIYICIWFITMYVEPLIVTEEFSNRKLYLRMFGSFNAIISILGGLYFGISPSCIKISFYCLGYCLFSSGFQAYLLRSCGVGSVGNVVSNLVVS
jgi:hypothetical protein